jgi:N-acetylmuramoyl-L-alanine amidase
MGFIKVLTRQLDSEPRNRSFAKQCCANMSKYGLKNLGVKSGKIWTMLYYLEGHGALIEIGYLTNDADFKYITSEKGQKEISGAIFRAVKSYVENVRKALLLDSVTTTPQSQTPVVQEPKPMSKAESGAKSKSVTTTKRYAIQLLASVKRISTDHPELKSYRGKVWILEGSGSLKYKYCYGDYAEKGMAQEHIKAVRKEFPQAFIVAYDKQL